jgi:Skp family chaperone for outer membrane proteins
MQITKKTMLAAFTAALLIATAPVAFGADTAPADGAKPVETAKPAVVAPAAKIGYVDVRKVGQETETGKSIAATLKERYEKLRVELGAKSKKLEKQKAALEAKVKEMTKAQREAKIKELENGLKAYQAQVNNAEKEMREKEEALTSKFLAEIEAIVKEFGRSNGYAMISTKGGLIYNDGASEPKDLTDDIMKLTDAKNKK